MWHIIKELQAKIPKVAKDKANFAKISENKMSQNSGGYNIYHEKHKFSKTCGGGDAERHIGKLLAKNGKQVEFLQEDTSKSPDIKFDDKTWDIKSINDANIGTIRKYLLDACKADSAIFYWDTREKLIELNNAANREIGRLLKGQIKRLPKIYYMDKKGILKLLWENKKGLNK